MIRLLLVAALAGCTRTLPVAMHANRCEPGAMQACAAPMKLAHDATYAQLVDALLADRQALRECTLSSNALRASIDLCNQASDEFNNKIDAVNRLNGP